MTFFGIFRISVLIFVVSTNSSFAEDPVSSPCRVESVFARYYELDGKAPLSIKSIGILGAQVAKNMVIDLIDDIIPASKAVHLIANLSGAKAVNVYVIYAHRFVHNNKPGSWYVSQKKLWNGDVDYFLPGQHSLNNANSATEYLEEDKAKEWNEDLKKQCKEKQCR